MSSSLATGNGWHTSRLWNVNNESQLFIYTDRSFCLKRPDVCLKGLVVVDKRLERYGSKCVRSGSTSLVNFDYFVILSRTSKMHHNNDERGGNLSKQVSICHTSWTSSPFRAHLIDTYTLVFLPGCPIKGQTTLERVVFGSNDGSGDNNCRLDSRY